ncbi:MAG: DUF5611 family protein [Methanomicrobiales archaeon]|nr:DUF5611 family protein [Methanomicrobiales archaeon]
MQEFQVKRGLTHDLKERVVQASTTYFGIPPREENGILSISYGALKRLEVRLGEGGKSIIIDTESNKDAPDAMILDTNKRFRQFLEETTGFNTKERVKRAKKAAEEES